MKKELKMSLASKLLDSNIFMQPYRIISPRLIKEMLKDIHIAEAVEKLKRNTASRDWSIVSDKPELRETASEISERFSDLDFNKIVKYFNDVKFHGYGAFELVWNENFTLSELVPIPQNLMSWDYNRRAWKMRGSTGDIFFEDPLKWLVVNTSVVGGNKYGESLLEPLIPTYEDKLDIRSKMRSITNKYGEIITVFAYDEDEDEETVAERAKQVKSIKGSDGGKGSVVATPVKDGFKLKDWYDFIKLDDLKTEIHQTLEDRFKRDIQRFILGADYSDSGSSVGSNARDQVQQDEQGKIEDEICKFIRDSFQAVLRIDSQIYGYDHKSFYLKLEKERDQKAEAELNDKKADTFKKRTEAINVLSQAGYELTPEYLAETLGVPVGAIVKKEPSATLEFENGKKKSKTAIAKKRDLNLSRVGLFKERNEETLGAFTKLAAKQIKKAVEAAERPEDLKEIKLDLSHLQEHYILATLNGMMDEDDISSLSYEFEDNVNPYNLNFEDAISWFMSKKPILAEDANGKINEIIENFHIISRSVELEVTKTLVDNLAIALKKKETFEEWKKRSKKILKASGFADDGWYLANVYRTNMVSAYSVGRYTQQEAMKDVFEYWFYDAVFDGRTSLICKTLDGKVYRADDPIWGRIYPPNHYQCRSSVIALTKEEFIEAGYTLGEDPGKEFFKNMKSFDGNPGKTWSNLKKRNEKKEKLIQLTLDGM